MKIGSVNQAGFCSDSHVNVMLMLMLIIMLMLMLFIMLMLMLFIMLMLMLFIMLGIIHYFQHFCKSTESMLGGRG